jgi:hypothetical protein
MTVKVWYIYVCVIRLSSAGSRDHSQTGPNARSRMPRAPAQAPPAIYIYIYIYIYVPHISLHLSQRISDDFSPSLSAAVPKAAEARHRPPYPGGHRPGSPHTGRRHTGRRRDAAIHPGVATHTGRRRSFGSPPLSLWRSFEATARRTA